MADHIKIRTAPGTWVVRAAGAVIAESTDALEVTEGDRSPVIYFPRADVGMAFLEPTDSSTRCPYRGQASYFTVTTMEEAIVDAAWSYEAPMDPYGEIAGHVAFSTDRIAVEQL
ncbi:MAG: DUF427 domain-containing protein [Rhodobacteraceae bacterium]|jgi:uncharacterized protein (DUF427 family)|nr:DUF427 domain-containing protein [Paracoccaceae bacterium]